MKRIALLLALITCTQHLALAQSTSEAKPDLSNVQRKLLAEVASDLTSYVGKPVRVIGTLTPMSSYFGNFAGTEQAYFAFTLTNTNPYAYGYVYLERINPIASEIRAKALSSGGLMAEFDIYYNQATYQSIKNYNYLVAELLAYRPVETSAPTPKPSSGSSASPESKPTGTVKQLNSSVFMNLAGGQEVEISVNGTWRMVSAGEQWAQPKPVRFSNGREAVLYLDGTWDFKRDTAQVAKNSERPIAIPEKLPQPSTEDSKKPTAEASAPKRSVTSDDLQFTSLGLALGNGSSEQVLKQMINDDMHKNWTFVSDIEKEGSAGRIYAYVSDSREPNTGILTQFLAPQWVEMLVRFDKTTDGGGQLFSLMLGNCKDKKVSLKELGIRYGDTKRFVITLNQPVETMSVGKKNLEYPILTFGCRQAGFWK